MDYIISNLKCISIQLLDADTFVFKNLAKRCSCCINVIYLEGVKY